MAKSKTRRRRAAAGSLTFRTAARPRSRKMTFPLAVIGGFAPYIGNSINAVRTGGVNGLQNTVKYLVPYDPAARRWTMANLGGGLWPIIAGLVVHRVVGGMLGVNRTLARMNVPFIRI